MTFCSQFLVWTVRYISELKNQFRLFLEAGSDQLLMELDLPIRLYLDNFPQIEGAQSVAPKVISKKLFKNMIKAFNRKH